MSKKTLPIEAARKALRPLPIKWQDLPNGDRIGTRFSTKGFEHNTYWYQQFVEKNIVGKSGFAPKERITREAYISYERGH